MVAIPECHNATGKWGEAAGLHQLLERPAAHCRHPGAAALDHPQHRQRGGDGKISDEDYLATYGAAVESLRRWGYTVPIV